MIKAIYSYLDQFHNIRTLEGGVPQEGKVVKYMYTCGISDRQLY